MTFLILDEETASLFQVTGGGVKHTHTDEGECVGSVTIELDRVNDDVPFFVQIAGKKAPLDDDDVLSVLRAALAQFTAVIGLEPVDGVKVFQMSLQPTEQLPQTTAPAEAEKALDEDGRFID